MKNKTIMIYLYYTYRKIVLDNRDISTPRTRRMCLSLSEQ